MASLYPAQYLILPLHAQDRLPPAVQSIDLELLMVAHSAIAFLASNFWVHQPWALPLSLFGLIACVPSLLSNLLPHFLAFWIASIPLDVVWLIHRSDQARSITITMMGINMCLKLVSAAQAARALQAQGALPDLPSGGGFGGGFGNNRSSGQPWLNGGSTAPFGLPGSWSGQQGPYTDAQSQQQRPSSTPYRSIYDEEAQEADAPQVRVENVASSVAAAAAAGRSKDEPNRAQYNAIG
ncbi:uncharacterized protein FA14DRAFT_179916 [Meira miltonrushii]|uniref:Uncharacterized protein n=1 Tax=Meira miltonrushii TaxID=1280837 RepID=A0A316V746_9BASI|nr:uncharacterized protein FA14DRAFT_179916 [Meira miltonrushii]PWN33262.1 hypothetical protein FA14DRAFT_179916 [Meira miltonrushii]